MLAPHIKKKVDELCNRFWAAGLTNPLVAVEQITYLLFLKRLEDIDLKRQQQDATMRREDELADGHAEFRFAGYVTVSAPDEEALERSCAEVEHAAQQARLELTRLYGQQAEGFTFTLPLARGLT